MDPLLVGDVVDKSTNMMGGPLLLDDNNINKSANMMDPLLLDDNINKSTHIMNPLVFENIIDKSTNMLDPLLLGQIVDKSIPDHFLTAHENDMETPQKNRRKQNPYSGESDEKREARLAANRERMRNIRMNETPEQKQARQAYNRIRARINLIRETAEQRQRRLESNRERMKANREKYSEQRRRMRALETPEKREKRLLANRLRNRNARLFESEEQRERRRAENRERQRLRRAQETPEEVELRRSYNRARMTLRRSLMKLKPTIDLSEQYTFPKQENIVNSYSSDADIDVDLDYVIPDVVINMVEDPDVQNDVKPPINTLMGIYNDDIKPDFNVPGPLQPHSIEYIQKCITTIDNILISKQQTLAQQQKQLITETALGGMKEVNEEENRSNQFADLIFSNIKSDN